MEDRINVVLYCRVSSDEQAEGSSLDEQERRLRMYCASLKMNVLKVYKDDSSAKYNDIRHRPMFGEMYVYCKLHQHLIAKILFLAIRLCCALHPPDCQVTRNSINLPETAYCETIEPASFSKKCFGDMPNCFLN